MAQASRKKSSKSFVESLRAIGASTGQRFKDTSDSFYGITRIATTFIASALLVLVLPWYAAIAFLGFCILTPASIFFEVLNINKDDNFAISLPNIHFKNGVPHLQMERRKFTNSTSLVLTTIDAYARVPFEPLHITVHYLANICFLPIHFLRAIHENTTRKPQPFTPAKGTPKQTKLVQRTPTIPSSPTHKAKHSKLPKEASSRYSSNHTETNSPALGIAKN